MVTGEGSRQGSGDDSAVAVVVGRAPASPTASVTVILFCILADGGEGGGRGSSDT